MLRSIAAVAAGLVVIAILDYAADAGMHAAFPQAYTRAGRVDAGSVLAMVLAAAALVGAIGSAVSGLVAGGAPMRHALILGVVSLAVALPATYVLWDTAPAWYHAASLALIMPAAWAGGLAARRLRRAS